MSDLRSHVAISMVPHAGLCEFFPQFFLFKLEAFIHVISYTNKTSPQNLGSARINPLYKILIPSHTEEL